MRRNEKRQGGSMNHPLNKDAESFDEAVKDFFHGATVLIGGFGTPGGCPSAARALANLRA